MSFESEGGRAMGGRGEEEVNLQWPRQRVKGVGWAGWGRRFYLSKRGGGCLTLWKERGEGEEVTSGEKGKIRGGNLY